LRPAFAPFRQPDPSGSNPCQQLGFLGLILLVSQDSFLMQGRQPLDLGEDVGFISADD
jgi:hypothetical protein